MKKMLLTLIFALLSASSIVNAAVKPGENLLFNGSMNGPEINPVTGEHSITPNLWIPTRATEFLKFTPPKGPDGKGIMAFSHTAPEGLGKEVTVKQSGFKLVKGEKYRISAMVRTKNFTSPHCGIIVYDYPGWYHEAGIRKFPENQDWTKMSAEFNVFESPQSTYSFAMFACEFKGTLEISDVKLEAISELALQKSEKSELVEKTNKLLLIPWEPLLNKIAIAKKGHPEMTFLFSGLLPEGTEYSDYDIHYSVDGVPEKPVTLKSGQNTLQFRGNVKPGDFKLALSIVHRADDKVILSQEHTATFVPQVKTSDKGHRRLNNLVVELLSKKLKKSAKAQECKFCTMRDGWVFIAAKDASADALEIVLDGKLTVITAKTPRLENFREIPAGEHTLNIKGATNGGSIIVRSIPEIYNYKPCCDSMIPELPHYDWDFQNKYVHYAITTHNDGLVPEEHRKEFFDAGYKWIGSVVMVNVNTETVKKRLETCPGMNEPQYHGVSCDEIFFSSLDSILPFTEGLKQYVPKNDHVIYTWITGKPTIPGIDNDFLATCVNSCHSRGRLISEVYCRTLPTIEEAREYLNTSIVDRVVAFKKFYPDIISHWGLIFGNFIQIPVISLAHHPNVDYKYYLDMQFNIIANHPECKDMAITGYWGSRHCDLELYRWCFMLTRHYCIEGKKNMLSDEYGFSYAPGHIVNGDFIEGLDGWTCIGNVTTGNQPGYGHNSQNRWSAPSTCGNSIAIITKKEDETSSLTQVAKGLIPGRTYCFQFTAVDYNDLKASKFAPKRVPVDVTLDDTEIDKTLSWVHVDKRDKGQYAFNNNVPKCNLHHIVFKALKPEIKITIDNRNAAKGDAAAINYITLNPYLTEE